MKRITLLAFAMILAFSNVPYAQEITQTGLLSSTGYQSEDIQGAAALENDPVQKEINQRILAVLEKQVETGQSYDKKEFNQVFSTNLPNDAEKTFKSYLADPIPESIKNLEGESVHWSGFSAKLIFKTDQKTLEDIIYAYKPVAIEDVVEAKEWFGEDVTNSDILCYQSMDAFNQYYIFWNKASQQVFFKGIEISDTMRAANDAKGESES